MNIFAFLSGYADGLSALPDEQLGQLVRALLAHEGGAGCPEGQMPPSVSLTFNILWHELDMRRKSRLSPSVSYLDILADLPADAMGALAKALFAHARTGTADDSALQPLTRLAYRFIRRDIDSERLRREHLRDAGAKGGKSKKNTKNASETGGKHSLSIGKAELKQCSSSAQAVLKHSLSIGKALLKQCSSSASQKDDFSLKKLTNASATSLINNYLLENNNNINIGGEGENAPAHTCAHAREACGPAPTPSPPDFSVEGGKEDEGGGLRPASPESEEIMRFWNAEAERVKARVRRITLITPNRLAAIHARLRDCGGDIEVLKQVLRKFVACPYANGDNPRAWVATFDWLMAQDNFAKAAEGNYDDRRAAAPAAPVVPDMTQALAAAREPQPDKDEELRRRLLGIISLVKRNPKSSARKSLEAYAANGTLKRLGIEWSGISS